MSGSISNKIVTNGLIFNLDSANPKSYVSGSTRWNSIDFNNNFVTLNNGPTYSNNFAGIISFDGSDDTLSQSQLFNPSIRNGNISGETPNIDFELTFEIVFRLKETLTGTTNIFRTDATSFATPPLCLYRLSGNPINNLNSAAGYTKVTGGTAGLVYVTSYNLNQWYHFMMSMRKTSSTTGEWFLMRNGVILTQSTLTDISWWQNYSSSLTTQGNRIQGPNVLNHDRAIMRLYNKGLTQNECLQNFNAIRDRFKI